MSAFRVLFVCTANHCRSPIAEQLMIAACDDLFGPANTWMVGSAGTEANQNQPIHHYSANVLLDRGVFVEGHRARQITEPMLRQSDLILTATRQHRAPVVRLYPAAIGRTFTILQFARLTAALESITAPDPDDLGRLLVAEAKAIRALQQPVPPEQDDLTDPMGGPLTGFQACAATLDKAIAAILGPLKIGGHRARP